MYKNFCITLAINDFDKAINFYCKVLDFKIFKDTSHSNFRDLLLKHIYLHDFYIQFELGDVNNLNAQLLSFELLDIDKKINELKSEKIDIDDIQEPPFGKFIYLTDPFGHKIILSEIFSSINQ